MNLFQLQYLQNIVPGKTTVHLIANFAELYLHLAFDFKNNLSTEHFPAPYISSAMESAIHKMKYSISSPASSTAI
jgi:hypothetical protein